MMRQLFSVFDSKAQAFMTPFVEQSPGTSSRAFEAACNEQGHIFNAHPEDFTLFYIGDFDDATASIETLKAPEAIAAAIAMVRQAETPLFDLTDAPQPKLEEVG